MDPAKKKKIISALKQFLLDQLKGAFVKTSIKLFLNSGAGLGFKAWVIKFVATELYEEIGEPVAKAAMLQVGYLYDRHEGRVIVQKFKEAENGQAYDDAVDDIFKPRGK
jgi:hypothetical protein